MTKPYVLLFDLECFHMEWGAELGSILCMGWKELNKGKVHIESISKFNGGHYIDDLPLVGRCRNILEKADMWITYNGLRFDVPFLQTRLLIHQMSPLRPVAHKDLYPTIKWRFKFSKNSLWNVQRSLSLENSKTPVNLDKWLDVIAREDRSALKEIEEHCKNDVLVLEEAYNRVMPFMQTHPRLYGYQVCNKCGGNLISRGHYVTAGKQQKHRFSCTSCGGWGTRLDKPKGTL